MLILNKYVPVKTKILRASHVPYMKNSNKGNHETNLARDQILKE